MGSPSSDSTDSISGINSTTSMCFCWTHTRRRPRAPMPSLSLCQPIPLSSPSPSPSPPPSPSLLPLSFPISTLSLLSLSFLIRNTYTCRHRGSAVGAAAVARTRIASSAVTSTMPGGGWREGGNGRRDESRVKVIRSKSVVRRPSR